MDQIFGLESTGVANTEPWLLHYPHGAIVLASGPLCATRPVWVPTPGVVSKWVCVKVSN